MDNNSSPKWKFRGGQLCLDFVNTVGGRVLQKVNGTIQWTIREERIKNYEDLIDWSKTIGLVNDSETKRLISLAFKNSKEADLVFRRAYILRESLFGIFRNIMDGKKPQEADVEILNGECIIAREHQKLFYTENKFEWNFAPEEDQSDCIIWPIAINASELLVSNLLDRIHQCPGENCGWLFLDTSKNKSRQWCDMKDCGNLSKVRRFREKQK